VKEERILLGIIFVVRVDKIMKKVLVVDVAIRMITTLENDEEGYGNIIRSMTLFCCLLKTFICLLFKLHLILF
jgi:hypothetical protein